MDMKQRNENWVGLAALAMVLGSCSYIVTSDACAAEGDVTVHTVSTHIGVSGLNNINPGVAYDVTDNFRVGALVNSYKKPSAYAALMIPMGDRLRIGAGVISGYRFSKGDEDGMVQGHTAGLVPLVAVEVDITKRLSAVWMGQAINLEVKFR
jgi:hypothetical protein